MVHISQAARWTKFVFHQARVPTLLRYRHVALRSWRTHLRLRVEGIKTRKHVLNRRRGAIHFTELTDKRELLRRCCLLLLGRRMRRWFLDQLVLTFRGGKILAVDPLNVCVFTGVVGVNGCGCFSDNQINLAFRGSRLLSAFLLLPDTRVMLRCLYLPLRSR